MSSTVDKVKDALHLNKHSTTHRTHNTVPEGTAGPHSSRVANAADPRIDSDLDSSRHNHTTGTGTVTGTGATGGYSGTSTTTAGPHRSNLANKVDPRVDSDLDGSRRIGAGTNTGVTGGYNSTGAYNSTDTTSQSTAGPHSSNLANKIDPRVDSDLDGSRRVGAGTNTGVTGAYTGASATSQNTTGYSTGTGPADRTAGTHSSNIANKLDPRIDSDLDGSRRVGAGSNTATAGNGNVYSTTHTGHSTGVPHSTTTSATGAGTGVTGTSGISSATPGSGNAPNTAGPHNSDTLNKLDPRVDSDVSGGKTYGGNKTFQ